MTTLAVGLVHPHAEKPVHARIEVGHWVVECGTKFCRDALRMEYGTGFLCPTCGIAQDVIWPSPADVQRIVALLAARPDPMTRNWLPGETVQHLLVENLAHGIDHASYPELGAAASRIVLDASGDGPPALRILDEPAVIDANPALEIGA